MIVLFEVLNFIGNVIIWNNIEVENNSILIFKNGLVIINFKNIKN